MVRVLGAVLLLFGLFPIFRVFNLAEEATHRRGLLVVAETALQFTWWGSLLVVSVGVGLAVLFSDAPTQWGKAFGAALTRIPLGPYSVMMGLLATGLAMAVGVFLYEGLYSTVDEMVYVIHARYLAMGTLAGPALSFPEGWLIPNTLMAEDGWVSQYPPGHLLTLGAFIRLGIPRLCGPVLMGITVWLLTLSYPRLLRGEDAVARSAALLTALCPFLIFLAGGGLSHLTAGAVGAAVLYGSLRSRSGNPAWALAVGAAVGMMVCTRPLIGLVVGAAIPATLWIPEVGRRGWEWGRRRGLLTLVGGLPFAVLLGWYNERLFGHWLRFGYTAAFGRNHGLGFHLDPWGYLYGLPEALGFSSIDILAFGVQLLETPPPLTVLLGGYLLLGHGLPKGGGTLLAWAFLPILANSLYWFHDPRMLFEAAPAWIFLAVLGAVEIVRRAQGKAGWRKRVGEVTAWCCLVALLAAAGWGVPSRWNSQRWPSETLSRIRVPAFPPGEAPLVFVHTSWDERLSARLQGAGGMRQDSVVLLLHRTTTCRLHSYSEARVAQLRDRSAESNSLGGGPIPALAPEGELIPLTVAPELSIRTQEGEALSPECLRQLGADRFGAVALAPLLWQGDLPGIERGLPMFVRDQGPDINQGIQALFPERPAYLFTPVEAGGPPVVVDYPEGIHLLWGEKTGEG